jgi:hypothetical protein
MCDNLRHASLRSPSARAGCAACAFVDRLSEAELLAHYSTSEIVHECLEASAWPTGAVSADSCSLEENDVISLNGEMFDFSSLGRQEACYVLKTSQNVLSGVSFVQNTFLEKDVTRESFAEAYFAKADFSVMAMARAVVQTYVSIFENMVHNLGPTFHDSNRGDREALRRRFSSICTWVADTENHQYNTPMRRLRNSCAHRAFVEIPFEHHGTIDALKAQPFYPGTFFDDLEKWLPPLRNDLEDIVQILKNEADGYAKKDYSVHPDGDQSMAQMTVNEERSRKLVEEKNPEVIGLQDQQDAASAFAECYEGLHIGYTKLSVTAARLGHIYSSNEMAAVQSQLALQKSVQYQPAHRFYEDLARDAKERRLKLSEKLGEENEATLEREAKEAWDQFAASPKALLGIWTTRLHLLRTIHSRYDPTTCWPTRKPS